MADEGLILRRTLLTFVAVAICSGCSNNDASTADVSTSKPAPEKIAPLIMQIPIKPGAIYEQQMADSTTPGASFVVKSDKTFVYSGHSTVGDISFTGGYSRDKNNQITTWDLDLPNKIDQTYKIEADRLIRQGDGEVFLLKN